VPMSRGGCSCCV
ncbi:hypothetical protein VCHC55C2_3187B, partial [Vibrio cholerae HC-55C2]